MGWHRNPLHPLMSGSRTLGPFPSPPYEMTSPYRVEVDGSKFWDTSTTSTLQKRIFSRTLNTSSEFVLREGTQWANGVGHIFSGWYTINDEDWKEMTSETAVSIMDNHSLYVLRIINTYTITSDLGTLGYLMAKLYLYFTSILILSQKEESMCSPTGTTTWCARILRS